MYNELFRIGIFIHDLKQGKKLTRFESDSSFFENEFRRIIMDLGYQWHQKAQGWQYLLEFHKLETERLLAEIAKLEQFQVSLAEVGMQNGFLQEVHAELIVHLTELTVRIDKMVMTNRNEETAYRLN